MMRFKYRTYIVPMPEEVQVRTLPRAYRDAGGALAGDPYRGGEPANGLHELGQHVSIALELGHELVTERERFVWAVRCSFAEKAWLLSHEIGSRWEMAWSHLDDARALAVRRGRDVAAYDRARDLAGDLSSAVAIVEVGGWRPVGLTAFARTARYRLPRLEPLVDAMAALQEAVPEARIERQPEPPNVRLGRRLLWKWFLIAIVAAVTIAIVWNLAQAR